MTDGKGYDKLHFYFLGTVTEYIRPTSLCLKWTAELIILILILLSLNF